MDAGYDEAYGGGGPGNSPRYGGTGPSGAGGSGGGGAAGAAAAPATSWTTRSRSDARVAARGGEAGFYDPITTEPAALAVHCARSRQRCRGILIDQVAVWFRGDRADTNGLKR